MSVEERNETGGNNGNWTKDEKRRKCTFLKIEYSKSIQNILKGGLKEILPLDFVPRAPQLGTFYGECRDHKWWRHSRLSTISQLVKYVKPCYTIMYYNTLKYCYIIIIYISYTVSCKTRSPWYLVLCRYIDWDLYN